MNKLCYRLMFSRLHGELRVVSELARRGGARSGLRRGIGVPRLWVTVRRTVWILVAALFASAAVADGIVPDGNAAPDQRPEVMATWNGLPQVNITAPNQAGISHNQYQQFDIDPRGAILNNSAVMTSTQKAGRIQGNPNLNSHAAPAQVILNEVRGYQRSQLRGFMEVAGGQAQVIIANPAGIVCNGCGTINAGRMTLTTGIPQLNADGSLAGYQVERGMVRVEGEGLNANNPHDTRYVDILARAVKINAGVWAKERLSVIAGRNNVSADGNAVRPLAEDTSVKPRLAIDMGKMGGMYSGHIHMIGTEAGMGVSNRNGRLEGVKTLTVSSDGKLRWHSSTQETVIQASGDVNLAARDAVTVHGKLHSGGQLSVQSRTGALTQSGTLAAAGHVSLVAASGIKSNGYLLAGSDVDSNIVYEGNLTLDSQGEIRASGHLSSKKDVIATGRGIDISCATVAAGRTTLIARQDGVVMKMAKIDSAALAISAIGDIDAQRARVLAGHWEVDANHLFNQNAVWFETIKHRESRFTLAGKLDNSDGAIESRQLKFVAAALTNQRGRLVALEGEGQYWRVNGPLDNTGGALSSDGNLTLNVGSLTNQDGAIKALAALKIHTDGDINNAKGMLNADNAVELEALGTLDNHTGKITGGQMDLAASCLNNAQGHVVSQGNLGLAALQGLDNPGGRLEARGLLSVCIHGEWNNRGGRVKGDSMAVAASTLNNAGGWLQSRGDLTLDGIGHIINAAGILTAHRALIIKGAPSDLLDNDGGTLQSGGALMLQGGWLTNRQSGWMLSRQVLTLDLAGSLDNQSGTMTGHGLTWVRAASLHNHQGVINALDTLDMVFTGALDNGGGRIFSKLSQALQARDIVNRQGWVGSLGGWSAVSGGFDNAEGRLQSNEILRLDAQTLNNAGGTVDAQRLLALRIPGAPDDADVAMRGSGERQTAATGIDNRGGVLKSGGRLDLAAAQLDNAGGTLISQGVGSYRIGEFNNQQGKVHSADALMLDGTQVNNQGGQLVSTQALQIRANALTNSDEGILSSQAALEVQVGRLNNRDGGLILGSSRISIIGRDIDNTAGRVQSAGPLKLTDVARLDNRQGHILANGALDIVTERSPADALLALFNQGGRLESDCALTLHAHNLDNQGGTLLGRQALTLSAQQGYSHHADETISSNGTVTISLGGAFHNQADWLLPGHLVLNAARVSNPAHLVAKTIQLTTGTLQNSGRLEAGVLTLHADTLDNTAALMGDDIAVRGRIIDHHGQPAVMAATRNLTLHAGERLSNRDGARMYSGDRLSLRSDDVIENQASFIEADGDVTVNARRLDNLPEGLVIGRDVEKNDCK